MLVVCLITLGDPGQATGGYRYHRLMVEAAPAHGARVTVASFPDVPFPLAALHGRAVVSQVRRAGAHVVLLDSIAAAFLAPWLALAGLDIPLVGILHQPPGGIDHGPLRTRVQARLDSSAYRSARLLLVASQSLAEDLAAAGVAPHRLRVAPPGRDVAPVPAGPRVDLRAGRRAALLGVGNWVERKDVLALLDAFSRLPPEAATLHLVGDERAGTPYGNRVRARLDAPDLAGRVVTYGVVPAEEMARLYRGADVFVLPSRKEPYGTVYGEALAAGLPVVGWRSGNLPHLVDHGVEGLVLEPGDVSGLAEGLERLALDPGLRRRLAAAARRRARSLPTWEDTASVVFASLHEVVDRR